MRFDDRRSSDNVEFRGDDGSGGGLRLGGGGMGGGMAGLLFSFVFSRSDKPTVELGVSQLLLGQFAGIAVKAIKDRVDQFSVIRVNHLDGELIVPKFVF